jgi:hypothetical protein
MPGFVRTPKDEARWSKAKDAAKRSKSKDEKSFQDQDWALVNHIYHNMQKEEIAQKFDKIMSMAKNIDSKEMLDSVIASLKKAKDYNDDDNNDDDLESKGFRVFDPDQEQGDDADKWLDQNDPEKSKSDYQEYAPDEDEESHQQEEPAGTTGTEPAAPEEQGEDKKISQFPQPSREDIAKLREYTRPWEQRARDTARLTAEAHKNPELHHQGHLIEARQKAHADKNTEYDKFSKSPEYQNADPVSQMEMDAKFHEDYNKKNPDYLKNAIKEHGSAHERGAKAHDIHAAAKDEQIRHILQGGAQADSPMSMEAAMQHAGGQKGEEGTTGSVVQDKAASFAGGNQQFLKDYAKNYENKHVKPKRVEEMGEYNEPAKKDVARILGEHPALKDPQKKAHLDAFFKQYYPLIGMNASRVMSKLGLDAKKSDLDLGSMHEAGMHGLMQAINDYDHDHPSKASFATHASNKIRGLQQTALRAQDQIPQQLRAAAKKHQQQQSVVQPKSPAAPVQAPSGESQTVTPPPAPSAPKPDMMASIASSNHSQKNDIADRLKRIDTHRSALGVTKKPEGESS